MVSAVVLSREIRKIDPALQIRTYAYLQSVNAPKGIKAENNIIVILCNTHGTNHLTGESSKFSRLLKAWSNAVSLLHVHEYEILFQAYPESPWASEFSFPKIFKEWAVNKVVGANIEQEDYFGSDMADMKFYLMAKFMEDPYRKDFDRLMEDFCDKYYGPAGKEVLQYRRTLKKLSDKAETRISWMCSKAAGHNRYITLNDMLALQKLFDQAEKKVKDSKIHTERLGRARLALDWLLGFELFRDYLRDWNKINPGKKFLPNSGVAGTAIAMVLGAAVMIIIAFSYAYMIPKYPKAGGEFTFTKECFGKKTAYVCGWFLVAAYLTNVPMNSTAIGLIVGTLELCLRVGFALFSGAVGWAEGLFAAEVSAWIGAAILLCIVYYRHVRRLPA